MSKVFFKRVTYQDLLNDPSILTRALKQTDLTTNISSREFIGLKIHFGEKGNLSHINPKFLTPLVTLFKKKGAKPFFFETNTLYQGKRMNAVDHINLACEHGFAALGAPVIIADGIRGDDFWEVEVNQKNFKTCFLAQALKDVDRLCVVSHFTGHMLTGFGAAVKNLGMGCAARKGKLLQHCLVSPQINQHKCVSCGMCAKNCSVKAIRKQEGKYIIDNNLCIGCAQCISVCPKEAVSIVWSENYTLLCEKMVEYALAVAQNVPCFYINFALYITRECDCMNKEKKNAGEDVGIFFSDDPVSIDKATVDLVNEINQEDLVRKFHPNINYLQHLHYAEEIGLGQTKYSLVKI